MDGWAGGWVEVKAVLRIAYSNKKLPNGFLRQEKCFLVGFIVVCWRHSRKTMQITAEKNNLK
jgi:hypothetical protein